MITPTVADLSMPDLVPASLEDFAAAVLAANPFTDNRINGPAPDYVDVGAIHQSAFEQLTALGVEARDARRGLGAMLWGEAGIGKSHVLSRLARWARQEDRACLVYLHNLQAGPDHLPRSLLKLVISILTGGETRHFHATSLYQLTIAFVREALGKTDGYIAWPEVERAYERLLSGLSAGEPSRAALVDRTAYRVLFHFFQSTSRLVMKRRDDGVAAHAIRWLSGDALDPDEAKLLDLPPGRWRDEPLALADNQQIKQVLVALSRMALSRSQPFVLCFDQVDNLENDQAAALARFLEALIDSAPNLLVVTAGIQASLLHWRQTKVIQDSAWDRLAQFEIALHRVGPADAERIVATRLAPIVTPHCHLDGVKQRTHDNPLFPFGRPWLDQFFQARIDARPREVINAARECWRRRQESLKRLGVKAWLLDPFDDPVLPPVDDPLWTEADIRAVIDRKVTEKISEHIRTRHAAPAELPSDKGHLLGVVGKLLRQCRDAGSLHGVRDVQRPPDGDSHDLLIRRRADDGRETTIGLAFLLASHGNETAAALRHLKEVSPPPDFQFLVTDERTGLPLGAKGRDYLRELTTRPAPFFRRIDLSFAQIAELDALAAVADLAQAGDLEIEPRPGQARGICAREVVESLHRQDRYRSAPLLRELLSPS